MDNQHKQIKGYRDLTAEEIALMNEIKAHGEALGLLVDRMDKAGRDTGAIDTRWVAIARTQLQQGLMALTRAVARPTTF